MEGLLTAKEVAERLRVHPKSVYRFVANGQLRATYLGTRTMRFTEESIERFIKTKKIRKQA